MKTHSELIEILNSNPVTHLHLERDPGTHKIPFAISDENEILAQGSISLATNEHNEYSDELAWALLEDCKNSFDSVTEYDSLVARTNPGKVS